MNLGARASRPEGLTTCAVCFCTDVDACVADGVACHWAEIDEFGVMGDPGAYGICSFCKVDGTGSHFERESPPQTLILPGDPDYYL